MEATAQGDRQPNVSWLPMIVILLAQIQLGFNVNALTISMGEIVADLDTTAGEVGTALVVYSLAVAGLVMLGAKLGSMFGARLAFQVGIAVQGAAMIWMALSPTHQVMIAAQGVAGAAAALAVPAFVVLIANNYRAKQQEQGLGLLAAAAPASGVLAFLLVGVLSLVVSWRVVFVMLALLAVVNVMLSFRLNPVARESGIKIDWIGAVLAATAITLISLGFNSVNAWGLLVAEEGAPFKMLGLSPVPIFIILGVVAGQGFFNWLRRQREQGKPQLMPLEILDSREERSTALAMLIISALGPAINFLIPLYIQIVQGRSILQTAVATVPYSIAILMAATFVVRVYDRVTPRMIGRIGFSMTAAGLFLLAYVIHNDWGTPLVIFSLLVVGLGEGALLTLVFNVLVSASPKELAGNVGALRGTINNLATGLGTALASVMAVAALSLLIATSVEESPVVPPDVGDHIELDDVDFISNEDLEEVLEESDLAPDVVDEVVQINTDARLGALKISFQVLAGLALLGIFPAGGLPPYLPGEIPATPQPQPSLAERIRKMPALAGRKT